MVFLVSARSEQELTPGEFALVRDAETDDVAFVWVLIHLGLRENPPRHPYWRPSPHDIDEAFDSFERLHDRGLVAVGRIEYADGGASGRPAPVRHVIEPLSAVRARVETAIATAIRPTDWGVLVLGGANDARAGENSSARI